MQLLLSRVSNVFQQAARLLSCCCGAGSCPRLWSLKFGVKNHSQGPDAKRHESNVPEPKPAVSHSHPPCKSRLVKNTPMATVRDEPWELNEAAKFRV